MLYSTKIDLESALYTYYDRDQIHDTLSYYYTKVELDELLTINLYNKLQIDNNFLLYYTKLDSDNLFKPKS